MEEPPKKRKRGNPNWGSKSDGTGTSGNPGGTTEEQKQAIFTARMSALAEMPANLAKLIEIRDRGDDDNAMKAIRLMSEWALPKLAAADMDGEAVRDSIVNVIVPTYEGDDTK